MSRDLETLLEEAKKVQRCPWEKAKLEYMATLLVELIQALIEQQKAEP